MMITQREFIPQSCLTEENRKLIAKEIVVNRFVKAGSISCLEHLLETRLFLRTINMPNIEVGVKVDSNLAANM